MKWNECCANCKKCVDGCSWSRDAEPVKGWIAEKTLLNTGCQPIESYKISYCPEFEEGDPLDDREMNMDGAMLLLEKIFESATNEFKSAVKEKMKAERLIEAGEVIRIDSLKEIIENCNYTMSLNRELLGKHCIKLEQIAVKEFLAENAK